MSPIWLNTKAITPSQRRSVVLRQWLAELKEGKPTHHSSQGLTVAYYIEALEAAGVPYKLTAYPGLGYYIDTQVEGIIGPYGARTKEGGGS